MRFSPIVTLVLVVTVLASAGGIPRVTGDRGDDESLVLHAANDGDVATIRRLARAGVDIDAVPNAGRTTALLTAAAAGRADAARALLGLGARVDRTCSTGLTPLAWAASAGRDTETVRALLRAGSDPNVPDRKGFTPLMYAARHGPVESVRELLERGANPAAHSGDGQTVADIARQMGRDDVLAVLKEWPARR